MPRAIGEDVTTRDPVDNPVAQRRAPGSGRKLLPGGRQERAQIMPVGHSMCEAVLLRFALMSAPDIETAAKQIRRNLHTVMTRAKRANRGAKYNLNTGHFRTADGDFIVCGVLTRSE